MSLLQTFYVFLPAFIANATPILLVNIPIVARYNTPVWIAKFGKNKTWAGLIGGTLGGILTGIVQHYLFDVVPFTGIDHLHGTLAWSMLAGGLLGSGALIGDIAKSFVKRKIGIRPGGALPFWDGVDHIVGATIFLTPLYVAEPLDMLILFLVSPVISLVSNTASYFFGWKSTWW